MKQYLKRYRVVSLIFCIIILLSGCSKTNDFLDTSNDSSGTKQRTVQSVSDDYYWYNGTKIPLIKNLRKRFILFDANNELSINASFAKNGLLIDNSSKAYELSKNIQFVGENRTVKSLKWKIIETDDVLNERQLYEQIDTSIIYEAPFFKTQKGEDLGLSNLFYVALRNEGDIIKLNELAAKTNVSILGNNKYMPLWYTLSCSKISTGNALEMANYFYETGNFEVSQPDLMAVIKPACVDDPFFSYQWNLDNTGQYGGTVGVDIKYCAARSITQGANDVIIAVIDDGVELSHSDLNIYYQSYDSETGTSPSITRGSHGTAVAGIMGALSNNNSLVAGIASASPIMSISVVYGTMSVDRAQRYADAFNFAWQNGASVINNSWSGGDFYSSYIDQGISNALTYGRSGLGCVVVFSAGNGNWSAVSYPANSHPDILAVGAITYCNGVRKDPYTCDGETNWGSNYGTALDVMAPGVAVPTTYLGGGYIVNFNGTSAAAPHVSATAALILSVNSNLTQKQVADLIEQSAQKTGGYYYTNQPGRNNGTWHNEMGYGLVNTFAAITAASGCNPIDFSNQTVSSNANISGCIITSQNVTITNNSVLTLAGTNYVIISSPFTINAGSGLTMTN